MSTLNIKAVTPIRQAGDVLQIVQELAGRLARGIEIKLPRIMEKEIDRSPEANLHYMRGLGYYYGNLPDHAIAEFMKTLAIEPRHAKARYWNARCYFDGKEWEHAAIEYERFMQDFPEHELSTVVRKELKHCRSSKADSGTGVKH